MVWSEGNFPPVHWLVVTGTFIPNWGTHIFQGWNHQPEEIRRIISQHQSNNSMSSAALQGCNCHAGWLNLFVGFSPKKKHIEPLFQECYLVGGLEHFLFFHILGIVIPIDFHIFQRGGSTTNQRYSGCWWRYEHELNMTSIFLWLYCWANLITTSRIDRNP